GETLLVPEITGDYKTDTYIAGVQPQTTVESFKTKLGVINGIVKVIGADDTEKTTGYVGTGDKVYIYKTNNELYITHVVAILGDTNGDGKINSTDRLRIRKHILKEKVLDGVYLFAGDTNKDGRVNSTDRLRIRKHILKEKFIEQ
ncbi:MAG: hypothetical protein IKY12_04390, partial [Clostridia bacterium]|nr:hypothetical protein [Clostridia bacterium]